MGGCILIVIYSDIGDQGLDAGCPSPCPVMPMGCPERGLELGCPLPSLFCTSLVSCPRHSVASLCLCPTSGDAGNITDFPEELIHLKLSSIKAFFYYSSKLLDEVFILSLVASFIL